MNVSEMTEVFWEVLKVFHSIFLGSKIWRVLCGCLDLSRDCGGGGGGGNNELTATNIPCPFSVCYII